MPNRTRLLALIQEALDAAPDQTDHQAVLLFDLDRFSTVWQYGASQLPR